jgi:hypothetical protein
MSVKVSTWVWHDEATRDLKIGQMLVLLALADIANDDGDVVFVSDKKRDGEQAALARKARMSVASFRRLTQQLVDEGLLSIARASQTSPNTYRIRLTAQSERLGVSGQIVVDERSERSRVSGHTSLIRTDVTTDVGGAQKRAARIPEPFIVTASMREWAAAEVASVNVDRSTRMFVDYWRAESGAKASKLDWVAAWRNWLRRDSAPVRGQVKKAPTERALSLIEMGQRMDGVGEQRAVSRDEH